MKRLSIFLCLITLAVVFMGHKVLAQTSFSIPPGDFLMYKNCVFDLYGTLIDINTDEWSIELWAISRATDGFSAMQTIILSPLVFILSVYKVT